jgi:hypothetical protein
MFILITFQGNGLIAILKISFLNEKDFKKIIYHFMQTFFYNEFFEISQQKFIRVLRINFKDFRSITTKSSPERALALP